MRIPLKPVISAFALSRILIILFAVLGATFLGTRTPEMGETLWDIEIPFFNLFARWDSGYYIIIAKSGYNSTNYLAFRPLFPLTLRLLSTPFSSIFYFDIVATITGFIENNILFLISLFFIYRITCVLSSEKIAARTMWFISFYPTSIFFSALYTESLYLLLTALYVYSLERESYLQSGFIGFLAGFTRPEGFLLCIPLFIKVFIDSDPWNRTRKIGSLILTVSSLFAILIAAQLIAGDYRAIFSAELSWDNLALNDLIVDSTRIKHLYEIPEFLSFWTISIPTVFLGVTTVFTSFYRSFREDRRVMPYYFHATILVLAYLAVGDVRSIPRFISTLIPMFWTLSMWSKNHPKFGKLLFLVFAALCVFGTVLFTNWYYFQ